MIETCKELSMEALCFFRPLNAKLYRVVGLPDMEDTAKLTELDQVVNTLCVCKKDGVWYFNIVDDEAFADIGMTLDYMNIPFFFITPDEASCN